MILGSSLKAPICSKLSEGRVHPEIPGEMGWREYTRHASCGFLATARFSCWCTSIILSSSALFGNDTEPSSRQFSPSHPTDILVKITVLHLSKVYFIFPSIQTQNRGKHNTKHRYSHSHCTVQSSSSYIVTAQRDTRQCRKIGLSHRQTQNSAEFIFTAVAVLPRITVVPITVQICYHQ